MPEDVLDKISYAVQLATAQGPLSHEPMQGMCVSVEDVSIPPSVEHEDVGGTISVELMGALTSEAIKTVRDAVRQGFLDWSPRLLLAMYSCEIQASGELCSLFRCVAWASWITPCSPRFSPSSPSTPPTSPLNLSKSPNIYECISSTYKPVLLTKIIKQPKSSAKSTPYSRGDGGESYQSP